MKENQFDVFFITPETLFSDEFQAIIGSVNIGLFVIDECHCISDWGHDFRVEYSNLFKVINYLPSVMYQFLVQQQQLIIALWMT